LSLIDYMIVNLTCVASDWLNYNTGWWRGLNPEGDHKKWGYILWDLDATFDYYINYSGVPNTNPDAQACDLEEIGEFMDQFFGYFGGDVGQHEKIFLKMLDESEVFQQLYYGRYADMMNTVYTCENMISTLDRMLDVIRPEMPRQIERWGGSMAEWESNVQDLKDFINARCNLVNEGMVECYDELSGPFELTLQIEPELVGEIEVNTLEIESFPWTGEYFGGMENKIKGKVRNAYEDDYTFSHWVTQSGSIIDPDLETRKATLTLSANDTLTAVFGIISSVTTTTDGIPMQVFPNPVMDYVQVNYSLSESADLTLSLYDLLGQRLLDFPAASGARSAGQHQETLDLPAGIPAGTYILRLTHDQQHQGVKVNIIQQ